MTRRRATYTASRLNVRQQVLFDFIVEYTRKHGYSPSSQEMSAASGLVLSGVDYALKKFERMGMIKRTKGKQRSIVVIEKDAPL